MNGQPKFRLGLLKLQCYKVATTEKIDLYSEIKLQVLNQTIITYEFSPLQNLHHRVLHDQANPLLGKFCLRALPTTLV